MTRDRNSPTDHIATADKEGRRIYVYPSDVKGRFKNKRTIVHSVLIVIFLLLPWLKINGHQAILLDVYHRKFAILGITFWAHDAPMLLFIFGGLALLIAFITTVWGRLWCGWACPQTVFIDSVFRKIERVIEGDHLARKKLDQGPLSFEKFTKKCVKWSAFVFLTLIISHSFLAYFVGTDALSIMIRRPPAENISSFIIMLFVTTLILFDFGWFKEQFCTVVCPYGRFQSILMDEKAMTIFYDSNRGEPRRGSVPENRTQGDCINCYKCVQVCPTGIDIRKGLQLECIACTSCIDICDDVMTRINKPTGLIRYSDFKLLRGKSLYYSLAILVLITGLTFTLLSRKPVQLTIIRASDTPYQVATQNSREFVLNRFKLDINNQSFENIELIVKPTSESSHSELEFVSANFPMTLQSGKKSSAELFVKFPVELLKNGRATAHFQLVSKNSNSVFVIEEEIPLVGPFK